MPLLILTQAQTNDKFSDDLGHARYQETGWYRTSWDLNDRTYDTLIREVLTQWKGRRYEEKFLSKFKEKFRVKPSLENSIQQSAAIIGFSGRNEGWSSVYYDYRLGNKPPRKEYWDLVTYWPKNPSFSLVRLRALHYGLIGGNIFLRNEAYNNLLKSKPTDSILIISEIASRRILRDAHGRKEEVKKVKQDFELALRLNSESPGTNFLGVAYDLAIELMTTTKNPPYKSEVKRIGGLLVQAYEQNPTDAKIVPDIKKYLNRLK